MYTHIAIEALTVLAGLLVIAGAFKLAAWEEWDDYRRHERMVSRNLRRQGQR